MEKKRSRYVPQPEESEYSTWVSTEVSYFAQSGSSAGIPSAHSWTSPPSHYLGILRFVKVSFKGKK
jgi:hypothetical protein